MGRHKKPIESHKYDGTYRGDRHGNSLESKQLSIAPRLPSGLMYHGGKEWKRVCELLIHDNLLTAYDLKNLEIYCMQFDVIEEAKKSIKKDGVLVKGAYSKVKNPAWQVMKESIEVVGRISSKFGFTPVDRAKISIAPTEEKDDLQQLIGNAKMKKVK